MTNLNNMMRKFQSDDGIRFYELVDDHSSWESNHKSLRCSKKIENSNKLFVPLENYSNKEKIISNAEKDNKVVYLFYSFPFIDYSWLLNMFPEN